MKKLLCLFNILTCIQLFSQEPNDCVNYIQICGNQSINLDVEGRGAQNEIGANACNSSEHNSLWIRITIEQGGVLGFTLTPQSSSLNEDYDFWIFGPNVSCGNLGNAIRCSTTNPINANLDYNTTGLRTSESDNHEGPGSDGDSFVRSLDVNAGESYFIVIDRPVGQSAFNLTWNGNAIIANPFSSLPFPFEQFPVFSLCSYDGGDVPFNFDNLSSDFLNGNTGFTVTYHNDLEDATIGANPIVGNTMVNSHSYYARIEDNLLNCFEIYPVEIRVRTVQVETYYEAFCDENEVGTYDLDLSSLDYNITPLDDYDITFYTTKQDAENMQNAINENITLSVGDNFFYINALGGAPFFCEGIGEISLKLESPISVQNFQDEICDDDYDAKISINLNSYVESVALSNNYSQTNFYNTFDDAENETNAIINPTDYVMENQEIVYIRLDNEACFSIAEFQLTVLEIPNLGLDETIYYCPEEAPLTLTVPSGFVDYSWSQDPNNQTNTFITSEPGDYTISASNTLCTNEKTFTLAYYTFPAIQFIEEIEDDAINVNAIGILPPLLYSVDGGLNWQYPSEFRNLEAGLYNILVRYENGCVSETYPFVILNIDNVITPNGDGINDEWVIPYLEFLENAEVKVYDRYGKIILNKKVEDPFSWDGKYLGRALPSSTYWFEIRLETQDSKKGWLLIKNRNSDN